MTPILPCMFAAASSLVAMAPAEPSDANDTEAKQELFYPVHVEVDVTALKKEQDPVVADETGARIAKELARQMRDDYRLRVVEGEGGGEATAEVVVRLSFIHYMDSHYSIVIDVRRPDGVHEAEIEYDCKDCFDEELIERAVAHLPEITARLHKQPADAEAEPAEGTTTPAGETKDETEPGTARPRRGLLIAGYTAIGVGAGLLAGGVVAATRPDRQDPELPWENASSKPLGIGLAIGGGLVLATGIALVVSEYACAKRGKGCSELRSSEMALLPWFDGTTAGAGLRHRF